MNTSPVRTTGTAAAGHRFAAVRRPDPRAAAVVTILLVVGVLHVLPGVALVAPDRLGTLYGVTRLDDDLLVLLRHRAMLLGLLGLFLLAAIARPSWRRPALGGALLSTVVFVLLALTVPTVAVLGI